MSLTEGGEETREKKNDETKGTKENEGTATGETDDRPTAPG